MAFTDGRTPSHGDNYTGIYLNQEYNIIMVGKDYWKNMIYNGFGVVDLSPTSLDENWIISASRS